LGRRLARSEHVCHRCDNPPCLNPDHLFLGSHADNMRDAQSKGRLYRAIGGRHPQAKLTEDQARAILADTRPLRDIASAYGITISAVSDIRCRRTWRHV
jgi:hypothetical protein